MSQAKLVIVGLRCDGLQNGFGNTVYISKSGCLTYDRGHAARLSRAESVKELAYWRQLWPRRYMFSTDPA